MDPTTVKPSFITYPRIFGSDLGYEHLSRVALSQLECQLLYTYAILQPNAHFLFSVIKANDTLRLKTIQTLGDCKKSYFPSMCHKSTCSICQDMLCTESKRRPSALSKAHHRRT